MRILIVDDSDDARDLTEAAILSAGYNKVVTAASASEALKILDAGRATDEPPGVDLILLDIVMPEMDGIEACARIRSESRLSDIPIIMVTSLNDMDSLSNAFVAGANDYVTKPINRIELTARVRSALKLKSELERRQARERELLGFLSQGGDRRVTASIDEVTGLFVGQVAEAYLAAARRDQRDGTTSILALSIDRFDNYRSAHGKDACNRVLAEVAQAVRGLAGTIGTIAAVYPNGVIVIVAPECSAHSAKQLGEYLRGAVRKLKLRNSESILTDHITASVASVTGRVKRGADRIHLLTRAVSAVQEVAAAGGDRVIAQTFHAA